MFFYSLMTSLGFHLKYFNGCFTHVVYCSRIGLFTDFHAIGYIWTEDSGMIWTLFRGELDTWGSILTMSISSPTHLSKFSPQHEIHYPNN